MRALVVVAALLLAGCEDPIVTFGRPGLGDGEFRQPRALSVSEHGIAVVDRSGRLQLFGLDGRFASKFAVAPDTTRKGLPCGVTWLRDGNLAVADTHQSYVRVYTPGGATVAHFGGFGAEPGQFNMPQRIAEDERGRLFVSDFGTGVCNRVTVFERDGTALRLFGGPETGQGGLERPMGIVLLSGGRVLVADQRAGLVHYDGDGKLLGAFGGRAPEGGTVLHGLCRGGGAFFSCDLAGNRLLRVDGETGAWTWFGRGGAAPGEFIEPWDVAWFGGRLYVADKGNDRVQRIDPDRVKWEAQ